MKTKITEADWLKLRDWNRQITKRIMAKLPADWYLTSEDVEGAVYDSIISLLSTYKGGSMSATSYCYQYAEQYTMRDLIREYERLKRQVAISDEKEGDGETVRHEIGHGEAEELTVDGQENLAAHFDRLDAKAKAT